MKKRTREKVALLVFALLVIFGGSVLLRYFETGRSWNVAASAVDDAFGQMQGYTAIVYDGTYDPLDALRPAMAPAAEGELTERPESIGAMVASELSRLPLAMRERPVYASDVRDLYEGKGAGVVTLNIADLDRYTIPTVLNAGDRKIGVVAIDYYATKKRLQVLRQELLDAGAQSLVCLVPRLSCLATTDGFQAVIVTDDSQAEPGRGEGAEGAHIMYAPEKEAVGVVLLTSLNVPSSKVYASL
ncbi:hypothetical protein VJ918_00530 [Adlercreutzia sp. R21]|uniref:Uncharacterized protein n=1 Tax=Adlercreutzia wanghongyangiae TaxID=3111451 RepID=A0ABU6IKG5_9ACTN|nr:hypothetical protein [Adlercreutzia sp. R21]MEC4176919.1 hypothetical protein [Adlercreutzia sp. R7]MEC4183290.1 hypothetical protein [Adlercreutzia sp. R21]